MAIELPAVRPCPSSVVVVKSRSPAIGQLRLGRLMFHFTIRVRPTPPRFANDVVGGAAVIMDQVAADNRAV